MEYTCMRQANKLEFSESFPDPGDNPANNGRKYTMRGEGLHWKT
jgi:hypothetical protein